MKELYNKMKKSKDSIVPNFIDKTQAVNERSYDMFSKLLSDHRIIFVTGEVNQDMANSVCAQILLLNCQSDSEPIKLFINSPGGVVSDGLAIYDIMQNCTCPIYTYCFGQASSMAAVLLAAGNERYSFANARIMIHQVSSLIEGKASDMEISYNEVKRLKATMNKILAKHTKKTVKEIEEATTDDNFMSAIEAKKFGLIDQVI